MQHTQSLHKSTTNFSLILLVTFQLYQTFHSPVSFDDAWMANYSKNWAEGHGYGLAVYDNFNLLKNALLSPIVIFIGLGSLFISLFGNTYWAPALAAVVTIQALLICCFIALRKIPELRESYWKAAFYLLIICLLCSTGNYIHRPERSFLWYSFHGDIIATLCVILTALVLAGGELTKKRIWLASLIIGVASQIKLLTLLPLGILLLGTTIRVARQRNLKQTAVIFCQLISVTVLLQLAWSAYVLYSLGTEQFIRTLSFSVEQIVKVAAVNQTPRAINNSMAPANKLGMYLAYFGPILLGYVIYIVAKLWRPTMERRKNLSDIEYYALLLIAAGVAVALWFIFLALPLRRYILPSALYILCGLLLMLIVHAQKQDYRPVILILLAMLGRGDDNFLALFREGFQYHQSRDDMLQAKRTLETLKKDGYILSGCGMNFELEYLMDGSRHFVQCDDARRKGDKFAVLNTYIVPQRIAVMTIETQDNVTIPRPPEWIEKECTKAFPSPYFEVWKCDKKP